jgi:hypothetical protein
MNQGLALKILSGIMNWDTDQAREQFAWLRLMSRLKYDGYQDYLAGARFVESLADWLQQFEPGEREAAYEFVRHHLVYVGTAEMQHLVEAVYPETVQPRLLRAVAERLHIPKYQVWSQPEATDAYNLLLRKTLFLGLSDGARIDAFRRANVGIISNEQVVVATQIDSGKWASLLGDLREQTMEGEARFSAVYLIDDFVASGTTLLKKREDKWSGKLIKFWDSAATFLNSHFEPDLLVCIHHYISSRRASVVVEDNYRKALQERGESNLFRNVEFSFGTILPDDLPIDEARYGDFMRLVEKYYDPVIETSHMRQGGEDARLGFGRGALPLILEHNTPNNSVALLWAETDGGEGIHAMRPLFRRRQRHFA